MKRVHECEIFRSLEMVRVTVFVSLRVFELVNLPYTMICLHATRFSRTTLQRHPQRLTSLQSKTLPSVGKENTI